MALTVSDLAIALRLHATGETLDTDISARLTRLSAVAGFLIDDHAPDAPEAVKEEATIVFCGYVFDKPSVTGPGLSAAFYNSGAAALLARWHVERSVALTSTDETGTTSPGQVNEDEVNRLIQAAVFGWALVGHEGGIPADQLGNAPGGGTGTGSAYHKTRLLATQTFLQEASGQNSTYVTENGIVSLTPNLPLPAGVTQQFNDDRSQHWLHIPTLPPDGVNAIMVTVADSATGAIYFDSAIPWLNTWGREIVAQNADDDGHFFYVRAASNGRGNTFLGIQYGSGPIPQGTTVRWHYGVLGARGAASGGVDQTARNAAAAAQTAADTAQTTADTAQAAADSKLDQAEVDARIGALRSATRQLPAPTSQTTDAGKIAALNAAADAYELVTPATSSGGGTAPPTEAEVLIQSTTIAATHIGKWVGLAATASQVLTFPSDVGSIGDKMILSLRLYSAGTANASINVLAGTGATVLVYSANGKRTNTAGNQSVLVDVRSGDNSDVIYTAEKTAVTEWTLRQGIWY